MKISKLKFEREAVEYIEPELIRLGFERKFGKVWFRQHSDRIDVIEMRAAQAGENDSYRLSRTSIQIEIGTFFRFAPHPMGNRFSGQDGLPLNSVVDCHFRYVLRPRLLLRDGWRNLWWRFGAVLRGQDLVLRDIRRQIDTTAMLWFERFDDLAKVYSHVVEVSALSASGPLDQSRFQSWGWVYGHATLEAFLALHLELWPDAMAKLEALLSKPHPGQQVDPDKHPKKRYECIEDLIAKGLSEAKKSLGSQI